MLTSFMSRAGAAVCIASMLGGSLAPAAAEGRRWIADNTGDVVLLIYGTPESDDMVLSLACEKESKTVSVYYAPQPAPTKAPGELPLTISSEAGRLQLTAAGTHSDEMDIYSLEAQTPLTPDLAKVLTSGKTLTLAVEKTSANLPLDDVAVKGAEELVAACRK